MVDPVTDVDPVAEFRRWDAEVKRLLGVASPDGRATPGGYAPLGASQRRLVEEAKSQRDHAARLVAEEAAYG